MIKKRGAHRNPTLQLNISSGPCRRRRQLGKL